jgi:hypothetical protein
MFDFRIIKKISENFEVACGSLQLGIVHLQPGLL